MIGLLFTIADELAIRFVGQSDAVQRKVSSYLSHFATPGGETAARSEVTVDTSVPPSLTEDARTVLVEGQLRVREDSGSVLFELPGITGWVRPTRWKAGLRITAPSDDALDRFVALALAPMLVEIAQAAGLLCVHAAAVAVGGRAILLPGPSDAGKSTIFRNCWRAGLDVLSDDLVWVSDSTSAPGDHVLHPFPRGRYAEESPEPTVSAATLAAIVCPTISDRESSRLGPIGPAEALDALLEESGFLAWRSGAETRFGQLARLAGARPAFRLEAGREGHDVPELLRTLVADDRIGIG